MSLNTPAANDAAAVADLASIAAQVASLLHQCEAFQERQTVHDYVTTWNNTATYSLNADGTIGVTDGAPNNAHPMVGLNVAAADLSAMVGFVVNDLVSFLTGVGTPQYTDRRGAFEKLLP